MRDITQLHPRLQELIAKLKKQCEAEGMKLGIGECLRTVAEQDALYAQGRTKPGAKVTNAKGSTYSSQHQWGIAVDVFQNIKGREYEITFLKRVGGYAKSLGLGWGGDWTSPVDMPHLYLTDWGKTPTPLKQKYGTPDKFFSTWNPSSKPQAPSGFVSKVQSVLGAKVDGIAGPETLSKTVTISKVINNRHPVVRHIQDWLNEHGYPCGNVDGIFGSKCDAAVRKLQSGWMKIPDGEITAQGKTWKKMLGIS